jgi:hypothetical protein
MPALIAVLLSALAGVLLAGLTTFTALQLAGDGSSNDPAISAPLVQYGTR